MIIYLNEKKWNRRDICIICGKPTGKDRDSEGVGWFNKYFENLGNYAYCGSSCVPHYSDDLEQFLPQIEKITGLRRKNP